MGRPDTAGNLSDVLVSHLRIEMGKMKHVVNERSELIATDCQALRKARVANYLRISTEEK
jgi:hypothetical protein